MSKYVPSLGWQTKYSRVSFSNERYSEVIARSDYQGKILMRVFGATVGVPLLAGGALLWFRYRRVIETGLKGAAEWLVNTVSR